MGSGFGRRSAGPSNTGRRRLPVAAERTGPAADDHLGQRQRLPVAAERTGPAADDHLGQRRLLPVAAERTGPAADDHLGRRRRRNQFAIERTCVLIEKASQRIRMCVLIRCMSQATYRRRSRPYSAVAVSGEPIRSSPARPAALGRPPPPGSGDDRAWKAAVIPMRVRRPPPRPEAGDHRPPPEVASRSRPAPC